MLGERTASFWLSSEIQQWYLDGQQITIERLPPDALKNLFRSFTQVFDGSTSVFSAPTLNIILERLNLQVHESDGLYGESWSFVSPEILDSGMASEGELAQDSTDTRIFCVNALSAGSSSLEALALSDSDRGYLLYPTPANGRTGRIRFVIKPSESGNLTMPINIQYLAEYYAIARAASKKSRDLDMMSRYDALFDSGIGKLTQQYAGRWGMNQSGPIVTIRDVIGYD